MIMRFLILLDPGLRIGCDDVRTARATRRQRQIGDVTQTEYGGHIGHGVTQRCGRKARVELGDEAIEGVLKSSCVSTLCLDPWHSVSFARSDFHGQLYTANLLRAAVLHTPLAIVVSVTRLQIRARLMPTVAENEFY